MSSVIAPSIACRLRRNDSPARSDLRVAGWRGGNARSYRMRLVRIEAATNAAAHAAYVHAGPATYSNPPVAGPMTIAVCAAVALDATARGRMRDGMSAGNIACSAGV